MEPKYTKKELRQRMQRQRDAMLPQEHKQADDAIWQKIFAMTEWKEADWILCYASYRSEIETLYYLRTLLANRDSQESITTEGGRHRIALPRVDIPFSQLSEENEVVSDEKVLLSTLDMNFYKITSERELEAGCHGIMEPRKDIFTMKDAIVPEGKVFMIMPGLCFDDQCHRIGYGGGYYDRYLHAMEALHISLFKVAVSYDFQVLPAIPQDNQDVLPNCIVTEKQIYGL